MSQTQDNELEQFAVAFKSAAEELVRSGEGRPLSSHRRWTWGRQRALAALEGVQQMVCRLGAVASERLPEPGRPAKWVHKGTRLAEASLSRIEEFLRDQESFPEAAGELAYRSATRVCGAFDAVLCAGQGPGAEQSEAVCEAVTTTADYEVSVCEQEPGFVDATPTKDGIARLLKAIAAAGEREKLWD